MVHPRGSQLQPGTQDPWSRMWGTDGAQHACLQHQAEAGVLLFVGLYGAH